MSVFINASRRCWKLNKNSLSLSEFEKKGIAMRFEESITAQFLSQHFAYQTPVHHHRLMSMLINASRRCWKLNENSLSSSEFEKKGIAMRCEESITAQFHSQHFAYQTPVHHHRLMSMLINASVAVGN